MDATHRSRREATSSCDLVIAFCSARASTSISHNDAAASKAACCRGRSLACASAVSRSSHSFRTCAHGHQVAGVQMNAVRFRHGMGGDGNDTRGTGRREASQAQTQRPAHHLALSLSESVIPQSHIPTISQSPRTHLPPLFGNILLQALCGLSTADDRIRQRRRGEQVTCRLETELC